MRTKCALLLVLAFPGCAQPQAPNTAAAVFGSVVNALSGAPVARAHVTLTSNAGEEKAWGAMTGADGRFSVTGVAPGAYRVAVERVGFFAQSDALTDLTLAPGENHEGLRLQLAPTGAVSGRVVNAEGEPVEGVRMTAVGVAGIEDSRAECRTDAAGRFRIGGLAAGRYRILAAPEYNSAPKEQRTDGTVDSRDARTYFPATLAYRGATKLTVAAGAESSGVDIRLVRIPVVSVSGKVEAGPALFPGRDATERHVFIQQESGVSFGAPMRPDGTFRIWGLEPGSYEIRAGFQSAPSAFVLAGTNSVEGLVIRPSVVAPLSGRLEFLDPAAQPALRLRPKITLVESSMRMTSTSADIDPDGTFRIAGLPSGKYHAVLSWPGAYVASVAVAGVASEGNQVDLSNGANGDVVVRVNSATGTIAGQVSDEKSSSQGTHVVLVSDSGDGLLPRQTPVGAGGAYSFGNVAPGKYRLVAVPDADSNYIAQGGRLDDYEDLMEPLEVHAGEKVTRDLRRREP